MRASDREHCLGAFPGAQRRFGARRGKPWAAAFFWRSQSEAGPPGRALNKSGGEGARRIKRLQGQKLTEIGEIHPPGRSEPPKAREKRGTRYEKHFKSR